MPIRLGARVAALVAVAALGAPPVAGAAPVRCVADCDGDGEVRIFELVAAVNIALGSPLAGCPAADADGDGRVLINELVDAVSDALYGCGVTPPTPPPPPPHTPTAIATSTATPTATPTPTVGVDVSGHWRSDRAQLQSSTCVKALTDAIRAAIRRGDFNCDYVIVQHGASADVTETCQGSAGEFTAAVTPDGTLLHHYEASDSTDGCRFTVVSDVVAPLAQSPTTISGTYAFAFESGCGLADCRMIVSGRFRRIP